MADDNCFAAAQLAAALIQAGKLTEKARRPLRRPQCQRAGRQ